MDQSSELRHAWRERKALGCLVGALGMAIVGVATIWVLHTRASIQDMQTTQGTVIDFGPHGSPSKGPIVEFVVDGQRHVFTDPIQSKTPRFKIGETVEVRYDPARPANARINTFGQLYSMQSVIGLIGAAFVAMCLGAWLRPPKTGRPPAKQL